MSLKSKIALVALVGALSGSVLAAPNAQKSPLGSGEVFVYAYPDGTRVHAFETADPMQDSVLAIETAKGLVGVESPAFTKDFQVWTNYLNGLEKPLNAVIFSNHPSAGLNAGEAWYGNAQTYASKNAQQAMQAGATKAIVDGLIPVYGKDFDASWAKITQTLPLGKSNIASVTVDVQEDGAGNIIYFPELKAAYIHMLGADTHSILAGAQHCDQFIAQLQQMKKSGVELIFSSHHAPEGASALDTKIAYVQAVKNIAQNSADKKVLSQPLRQNILSWQANNIWK